MTLGTTTHPLLSCLNDALPSQADGNMGFALIDPGVKPDARRWMKDRLGLPCTAIKCPRPVSGGDPDTVIPFLVEAPSESGLRKRFLLQTLQWAEDGALTWLSTSLDVQALAHELGLRMDVTLAGNMESILRFWDSRCLRYLHDAMDAAQRKAFFSVAQGWWYLDRREELQSLPLVFDVDPPHFVAPLRLTQEQEDRILESAEPDNILRLLREDAAEELEQIERKHRHEFVVAQLARAKAWGVESAVDLARFCMVALGEGEGFSDAPAWRGRLERVRSREIDMAQAIAEFAEGRP